MRALTYSDVRTGPRRPTHAVQLWTRVHGGTLISTPRSILWARLGHPTPLEVFKFELDLIA